MEPQVSTAQLQRLQQSCMLLPHLMHSTSLVESNCCPCIACRSDSTTLTLQQPRSRGHTPAARTAHMAHTPPLQPPTPPPVPTARPAKCRSVAAGSHHGGGGLEEPYHCGGHGPVPAYLPGRLEGCVPGQHHLRQRGTAPEASRSRVYGSVMRGGCAGVQGPCRGVRFSRPTWWV